MTSALDSSFGLAIQSAKGTPNATAGNFHYLFFGEGNGSGPMSKYLSLDQEIGSGPYIRNILRVGGFSSGAINFIPRLNSVGYLLLGALGGVNTTAAVGPATVNTHVFRNQTNRFTLPWFTMRRRLGAIANAGDITSDVKVQALRFNIAASDFIRAEASFIGIGKPQFTNDTSAWNYGSQIDTTDPFLTCKGSMELPTGTTLKVVSGRVTIMNNIPIDEQWLVAKLTPDDLELVQRAITFDLMVKLDDPVLYRKLEYGILSTPGSYPADWDVNVYREARLNMKFQCENDIDTGVPGAIEFHANDSSSTPNIAWTCQPVELRGNRQVMLRMTGTVLEDASSATNGSAFVKLSNAQASYAT